MVDLSWSSSHLGRTSASEVMFACTLLDEVQTSTSIRTDVLSENSLFARNVDSVVAFRERTRRLRGLVRPGLITPSALQNEVFVEKCTVRHR